MPPHKQLRPGALERASGFPSPHEGLFGGRIGCCALTRSSLTTALGSSVPLIYYFSVLNLYHRSGNSSRTHGRIVAETPHESARRPPQKAWRRRFPGVELCLVFCAKVKCGLTQHMTITFNVLVHNVYWSPGEAPAIEKKYLVV